LPQQRSIRSRYCMPPVSYTVTCLCPSHDACPIPPPPSLLHSRSCDIRPRQHPHPHTWRGRWMGRRPACLGAASIWKCTHEALGGVDVMRCDALRRIATHLLPLSSNATVNRGARKPRLQTDSTNAVLLAGCANACMALHDGICTSLPTHRLVWALAVGVPLALAASPPPPHPSSSYSVNHFIREK
jgi:hypothetical protein